MELDVSIGDGSVSIAISDPFHLDVDAVIKEVSGLAASNGTSIEGLDMKGLLPRMVRGVAGCESGCPANARDFVRNGFMNFELAYVEGGILTAKAPAKNGKTVLLKMFPDF